VIPVTWSCDFVLQEIIGVLYSLCTFQRPTREQTAYIDIRSMLLRKSIINRRDIPKILSVSSVFSLNDVLVRKDLLFGQKRISSVITRLNF